MKYAVVGGERREAQSGLSAECPVCGAVMTAKCGEHRVHHWAHRAIRTCDPWWENETEWHRAWKNKFPPEWQEFIRHSEIGEKHIADVKTESGLVLEFQHSFLRRNERESRERFYPKMIWVVDGQRRKRDRARFFAALDLAIVINREPLIVSVRSGEGALLRDWEASRVPVYFDFGDDISELGDKPRYVPTLWRLNPHTPNGLAYLTPISKAMFEHIHLKGLPFEEDCSTAIVQAAARFLIQQVPRPGPLVGFERYMVRQQRRRVRF